MAALIILTASVFAILFTSMVEIICAIIEKKKIRFVDIFKIILFGPLTALCIYLVIINWAEAASR
jgi:hypothetical protein